MQRSRFDARARSLGLTSAQWQVIAVIRLGEGCTQTDVAARLEISGVTVGRIIDRLDERGWVERRPDPGDLRAKRLYLRPAATPMLDRLTALGREEESLSLAGLSAADRVVFGTLLDRLIGNMVAARPDNLPIGEELTEAEPADSAVP